MRKSLFHVLGATAVLGVTLLTTTAASAAVTAAGPPADTVVTFTVTSGDLTVSAPGSLILGTSLPGTTVSARLGQMKVEDDRAALVATWTVSASLTDFTTGAGPTLATIPATTADYDPGQIQTTGTITGIELRSGLSGVPTPVVEGRAGSGNNTATWNPLIGVDIPPTAVGGDYTATLTQSVV